jgi:hypothetical protein
VERRTDGDDFDEEVDEAGHVEEVDEHAPGLVPPRVRQRLPYPSHILLQNTSKINHK